MLTEKNHKKNINILFKMLEFNPLYYEKNHVRKYHLIFFFWNFLKDFFFISEVLYERSRTGGPRCTNRVNSNFNLITLVIIIMLFRLL